MRTFGLLGKCLEHSFSASYFNEKFYKEGIDAEYLSFELENIQDFKTHFISILSGMDPGFPTYCWDLLMPQTIITLNLLRDSYAQVHGPFNFTATPMGPGLSLIHI